MSNGFQKREGWGTLFINDKKNEKAPDYKGDIVADQDYKKGDTIKIAGWRKETPRNHLISLRTDNYKAGGQYPKPANKLDDEVPF